MQQRIFDLIESGQFSEGSNGLTFVGDTTSLIDIQRVFYMNINESLVPFNVVICEPVFDGTAFLFNQIVAAYLDPDSGEFFHVVSVLFNLDQDIFPGFNNYIGVEFQINGFDSFSAFGPLIANVHASSVSINNLELFRGGSFQEESVTLSGTIRCP